MTTFKLRQLTRLLVTITYSLKRDTMESLTSTSKQCWQMGSQINVPFNRRCSHRCNQCPACKSPGWWFTVQLGINHRIDSSNVSVLPLSYPSSPTIMENFSYLDQINNETTHMQITITSRNPQYMQRIVTFCFLGTPVSRRVTVTIRRGIDSKLHQRAIHSTVLTWQSWDPDRKEISHLIASCHLTCNICGFAI